MKATKTHKTIIHIEPMGKPRMTQSDKWKKRPVVMRYWTYRDSIKSCLYINGINTKNAYGLNCTFYLSMPRTWSKKKKLLLTGKIHQQKPDLDNIYKGVLDAIFKDDSKIAVGIIEKRWADDNGARIELEISTQK